MGRSPSSSTHEDQTLNRGAWTASEDKILSEYIKKHGDGGWRSLANRAGEPFDLFSRLEWLWIMRIGGLICKKID